jgi:hypothetical protein
MKLFPDLLSCGEYILINSPFAVTFPSLSYHTKKPARLPVLLIAAQTTQNAGVIADEEVDSTSIIYGASVRLRHKYAVASAKYQLTRGWGR